jgi:hypothetical protein
MGLAETLGMKTFKGYRETNKRRELLPLKWQGKTKTLSSIANRLMVQNEYWATPCKKMEWLMCKEHWGDEIPKYIPYNSISQSTKLPAIYDGATTFNEFVEKKKTEGTLLIMCWQEVSKHGDPRFYVVAIEFKKFVYNKKNNEATFKPNKGSYVTGKISVEVGSKSYTIKAASKTFRNVPHEAVWIKCNTCETFFDPARQSLNNDIRFRLPKKKGGRRERRKRRERRRTSKEKYESKYNDESDGESKYNDDDESLESQLKF